MALQYGNTRRKHTGYTVKKRNKEPNLRRYIAALDFSLDQIKLREVYENVYGSTDLVFQRGRKLYTSRVVNVTFKYAVREYNRVGRNVYVKLGTCEKDVRLENHACVVDGELLAIELEAPLDGDPLSDELLGDYFEVRDGQYAIKKTPKLSASTAEVRECLYRDGFYIDGVHYVRWKRSSGSARVGKCLFIDEKLYWQMHEWELCGLDVKHGDAIDLAALESYTSLPTSSIIDVLELYPQNILVIDDYESVFDDYVVSVEEHDGRLSAERKHCEIANSIWDGQGLIDIGALGQYADKGMVLLRNLFFKCCCFNCNLQQWFADHGITDVVQLRGYTQAQRIEDIKLVTTPSSIKYVKFGSLEQWMNHVDPLFGVVKYDKKTHFFDGRMVHTHYQLLNTLQMTRDEVQEFLAPTFDYLQKLRDDPAVLRYHIKYPIEDGAEKISSAQSKNDIVYKMLGINDKFAQTKLYYDFRTDIFKSFTKSLKLGHVCVDGNYSVLCGNPIEMLLAVTGDFDGTSQIGVGSVHTKRFAAGPVLGSRSPHITCSNVWVPNNAPNEMIDKYMNPTEEILYINSIGENVLNRLSGCD